VLEPDEVLDGQRLIQPHVMPDELDRGWRGVGAGHQCRRIAWQQVQQQKHADGGQQGQ